MRHTPLAAGGAAPALALAALLASVAAGGAACAPAGRAPPRPACANEDCRRLTLRVRALDGHRVDGAALAGRVVLVSFWTPACPYCREELPGLAAVYGRRRASGFEIVGLVMDAAPDADLLAFAARHGVTWPLARATPQAVRWADVEAVPTSLLFDRHGRLLASWRGPVGEAALEGLVAAAAVRPGP